jgi:uncharacterized protein YeaO (DUF488 family)
MNVRLRRAYEDAGTDDGYRVLVDRIWPRGRTRDQLRIDEWAPELGPSTQLRRWFGHDPGRWPEFQVRYQRELTDSEKARALDQLATAAQEGTVTLVYAARDEEHNQARVLAGELQARIRHGGRRRPRSTRIRSSAKEAR